MEQIPSGLEQTSLQHELYAKWATFRTFVTNLCPQIDVVQLLANLEQRDVNKLNLYQIEAFTGFFRYRFSSF